MAFDSPAFWPFLLGFFVVYGFFPLGRAAKLWLLTAASVFFYRAGEQAALPLLGLLAAATYATGPLIARGRDCALGSWWLGGAAALDLAGLAYGWSRPGPLIPLGLSFFGLQCLSYSIDVSRGVLEPAARLDEFLAALFFFPKLVIGPLTRWSEWLPQFERLPLSSWPQARRGFLLIGFGLTKMAAAGLLLRASNCGPGVLQAWTGMLAFAGRLYGAFSGYSDIAVGLGLLLGFSLPQNFDRPYLAGSPMEFWRRWHMSFYAWLYDYLYLPLALRFPPLFCLLATVALAGLWHGARWTMLAYGLYHGVVLAAAYWISRRLPSSRWLKAAGIPLTFYLVLVGFALFRSDSLGQAADFLRAMHGLGPAAAASQGGAGMTLALVLGGLGFCHGLDGLRLRLERSEASPWLWPAAAFGLAFFLALGGGGGRPFTYLQF